MREPLLTVVIPAYNVELFLEETVLSILKAKNSNLVEVVIVNDGSKDNTLTIAQQLEKQYSQVKVVDKKNGGHGSTINAGLECAAGKYFRLLDGDDWFDTKEFESFLSALKKTDTDLILNDYTECFLKSGINRPVTFYSTLPEFRTLDLDVVKFPEWGPMLPTLTVKTSLLRGFGLKIDEHCYYVDQEYNLACYLASKTVEYFPFMVYQYRLERDGQSMQRSSLIKNASSHEKVCRRLLAEFSKHCEHLSEQRRNYLSERVIIPMCHMQYMIAIEYCNSRQLFLSFDRALRAFPDFYDNSGIVGNITRLHRKTNGRLLRIDGLLRKIANWKNTRPESKDGTTFSGRLFVIAGCLIAVAIVNLIVINYVNSEKTAYYWDLSGYWKNAIDLIGAFQISFKSGVKLILDSLLSDYNYLPLVPMLPFLAVFGSSRLSFVLIVLNIYVVPFAAIMTKAVSAAFINAKNKLRARVRPLVFAAAVLSPAVLIPVLNGRPDAICILVISLIFYLILKTRLEYISNYYSLAILTLILIVFRRYFCFFAICLYLSIFLVKGLCFARQYGFTKETIRRCFGVGARLVMSGLLLLLIMFVFARKLLVRYVTGGYGDVYSGYLLGDFIDQIMLFFRYYGAIYLGMALLGCVWIFAKHKQSKLLEFIGICIITSVLSFFLFTRVQTLGDQHMYIFVPFLVFSVQMLVAGISQTSGLIKYLSIAPVCAITILSLYSFTGIRSTTCSSFCYYMGISEVVRPRVRNDMDEIESLVSYLDGEMTETDYVYILSSSDAFNDDLLRNIHLPESLSFNLSGVMHVDKRDGFPNYFFDATYVIVADPIQTHLAEGSQDVITVLAGKILRGEADNLTLVKTFQLDDGVTLKIYKKDSPYSDSFLRDIRTHFQNKYPNYKNLYEGIRTTDLASLNFD